MNVIFQRMVAQNKLCLQNKTHAGHNASIFLYSDCDFYLYYTLVLYSSNHDLYIYTYYFLPKSVEF